MLSYHRCLTVNNTPRDDVTCALMVLALVLVLVLVLVLTGTQCCTPQTSAGRRQAEASAAVNNTM
jgi:hypothetical protein